MRRSLSFFKRTDVQISQEEFSSLLISLTQNGVSQSTTMEQVFTSARKTLISQSLRKMNSFEYVNLGHGGDDRVVYIENLKKTKELNDTIDRFGFYGKMLGTLFM